VERARAAGGICVSPGRKPWVSALGKPEPASAGDTGTFEPGCAAATRLGVFCCTFSRGLHPGLTAKPALRGSVFAPLGERTLDDTKAGLSARDWSPRSGWQRGGANCRLL